MKACTHSRNGHNKCTKRKKGSNRACCTNFSCRSQKELHTFQVTLPFEITFRSLSVSLIVKCLRLSTNHFERKIPLRVNVSKDFQQDKFHCFLLRQYFSVSFFLHIINVWFLLSFNFEKKMAIYFNVFYCYLRNSSDMQHLKL